MFCNPPYGRAIADWVRKGYEESQKPGTTVVMLIPSRTDTAYFHDWIFGKASEVRFLRGRLKFTDEDGNGEDAAPAPVQNPTGKPLDLKNRGKQAPAAAAELVPGRDYDPDTGEVYETAGQPTDDRQTTGGRNNMKVVKIAPAKEA